MIEDQRAILEAFVVDNDDLERLETLLSQFNIFEAVGAVRQELRHSDFLAFLLDPSQNHGLGDAFLKRFLERVVVQAAKPPLSAVEIDAADLRTAEVQRERQHVDIFIHAPSSRLVCAVENKVFSPEHSGQLDRYRTALTSEFPDHRLILVYLTPEGDDPSDEHYIPFSYTQIAALLDTTLRAHESTLGPDVRTLIAHYTAMLRRHVMSDSEIAELCRKIYRTHRQALDLIFEHRPDLQAELADILKQLIAEAGDHGLELDDSVKTNVRFAVTDWDRFPAQKAGQGWTSSRRILLFVFTNAPKELSLGLFIGPGPEPIVQAIADSVRQHPGVLHRPRKSGRYWLKIYSRPFLSQHDYDDPDPENLRKKIQAEWGKFLAKDLVDIREAIGQLHWPSVTAPGSAETWVLDGGVHPSQRPNASDRVQ